MRRKGHCGKGDAPSDIGTSFGSRQGGADSRVRRPDSEGLRSPPKDLYMSSRIDFKGWISHDRLDRL